MLNEILLYKHSEKATKIIQKNLEKETPFSHFYFTVQTLHEGHLNFFVHFYTFPDPSETDSILQYKNINFATSLRTTGQEKHWSTMPSLANHLSLTYDPIHTNNNSNESFSSDDENKISSFPANVDDNFFNFIFSPGNKLKRFELINHLTKLFDSLDAKTEDADTEDKIEKKIIHTIFKSLRILKSFKNTDTGRGITQYEHFFNAIDIEKMRNLLFTKAHFTASVVKEIDCWQAMLNQLNPIDLFSIVPDWIFRTIDWEEKNDSKSISQQVSRSISISNSSIISFDLIKIKKSKIVFQSIGRINIYAMLYLLYIFSEASLPREEELKKKVYILAREIFDNLLSQSEKALNTQPLMELLEKNLKKNTPVEFANISKEFLTPITSTVLTPGSSLEQSLFDKHLSFKQFIALTHTTKDNNTLIAHSNKLKLLGFGSKETISGTIKSALNNLFIYCETHGKTKFFGSNTPIAFSKQNDEFRKGMHFMNLLWVLSQVEDEHIHHALLYQFNVSLSSISIKTQFKGKYVSHFKKFFECAYLTSDTLKEFITPTVEKLSTPKNPKMMRLFFLLKATLTDNIKKRLTNYPLWCDTLQLCVLLHILHEESKVSEDIYRKNYNVLNLAMQSTNSISRHPDQYKGNLQDQLNHTFLEKASNLTKDMFFPVQGSKTFEHLSNNAQLLASILTNFQTYVTQDKSKPNWHTLAESNDNNNNNNNNNRQLK